MQPIKLTDENVAEIVERYMKGEHIPSIAALFAVNSVTIKRVLAEKSAKRPSNKKEKSRDIAEFASRVKSMLWRQNRGSDKKEYNKWKTRVEELESQEGANYSHNQAVVRASKEFPCLSRLFREYDVKDFDPNPDSHPQIQHGGSSPDNGDVYCENKEQSYRESIRWAIEAAGCYLRTGQLPQVCPCDAAWYLYRQAIEEPKDFLGRIGQIESKNDVESESRKNITKASKKSIAEIDVMLAAINEAIGGEKHG